MAKRAKTKANNLKILKEGDENKAPGTTAASASKAQNNASKGCSERGRGVTLKQLVDGKVLTPGECVLLCEYKGTKFTASLHHDVNNDDEEGVIGSLSRSDLRCIRSKQPDRQAVDGCVHNSEMMYKL